jgi:hypothetical protein
MKRTTYALWGIATHEGAVPIKITRGGYKRLHGEAAGYRQRGWSGLKLAAEGQPYPEGPGLFGTPMTDRRPSWMGQS